jgi:hypothetical protein
MSTHPVKLFYSYADADEAFRSELDKHLNLLQREGAITTWHKRLVTAGTDWTEALDEHLSSATVILLLISVDFMSSDYCYGVEMQRAIQRHQAGDAHVIPILLRPVDWQSAPFKTLKALPSNSKPVTSWPDRDEAFTDIAKGIRTTLDRFTIAVEGMPQKRIQGSGQEAQLNPEMQKPVVLKANVVRPARNLVWWLWSVGIALIGGSVVLSLLFHLLPIGGSGQTIPIINWTVQKSGTNMNLYSITWSGNQFVAVGKSSTILTSNNGVDWSPQNAGIANNLNGVTWAKLQFVAVGDAGIILTSFDGKNWTSPHSSPTSNNLQRIIWTGSQLVAVGDAGTILTSPDGSDWTLQDSGIPNPLLGGVAQNNALLVAVGGPSGGAQGNGIILTSPLSGTQWTPQQVGTANFLRSIAWSGSRFVVVGNSGTIFSSTDGTNWIQDYVGNVVDNLGDIVWSGSTSTFVVVGNHGTILSSFDGIHWTLQSYWTPNYLQSIILAGSQYVVVGANGTILTGH